MTAFWDYDRPLVKESLFKHMGRPLMATYDNWPEVIANIQNTRKSCSRMDLILGWEGADTRMLGHIYIAVVQSILLFGLETWVVTPHIKRIMGGFHQSVVQRILRKMH